MTATTYSSFGSNAFAGTAPQPFMTRGLFGDLNKGGALKEATKLGSMIPGVGTMFAAASFGLDLIDMFKPNPAIEGKAYQEAYNLEMQRFQMEQRNKQREEIYARQVQMADEQIDNNWVAAWEAWTSEQYRLNEVYDKAALASQGLLKQLVETQGKAAAREVYGKSARRGALVATLGAYGRTRAQLSKQLTSERTATERRMEKTASSLMIANKRAFASIANAPSMEIMPNPVYTDFAPSPLETGLKIANSAVQAGMKGYELTPEGDTFFGITKGRAPTAQTA